MVLHVMAFVVLWLYNFLFSGFMVSGLFCDFMVYGFVVLWFYCFRLLTMFQNFGSPVFALFRAVKWLVSL